MRTNLNRLTAALLAATVCLAFGCATQPDQDPHALIAAEYARISPTQAMSREAIEAGLEQHDRALFIKAGWIRDPYIITGPDGMYYLTGTTPNPDDPRIPTEPYNIGLDRQQRELTGGWSIVGYQVQVWRSADLIEWESLGSPFTLEDTAHYEAGTRQMQRPKKDWRLWAPEVHWLGDRWAVVHCPAPVSSLALSEGDQVAGPWTHPNAQAFKGKHDPSLYQDDDGTWYLLWQNTLVQPIADDFSMLLGEPTRIDPAGNRPDPNNPAKTISRIGHEGATMIKVGGTYIHFGTAWSTDLGRRGSYNLYYCASESITGPYDDRKFVGRFLGHGTPFQDKEGRWWCTAFYNGNVPPLPREGIEQRDLSETAQTINEQGVTIVPLEVRTLDDGSVFIRAKDPAYRNPGPDEAQQFEPVE